MPLIYQCKSCGDWHPSPLVIVQREAFDQARALPARFKCPITDRTESYEKDDLRWVDDLSATPPPSARDSSSLVPKRILLVEDDPATREMYRLRLQVEGYEVTEAEDGLDAIRELRSRGKPQLIVLDIAMPLMSGWEVIKLVKDDPELDSIPILVVTAQSFFNHPGRRKTDTGYDDLILKPVEPKALVEKVRSMIGKP